MSTDKSAHYLGDQGKKYFAYQHQGGLLRGQLNARTKFARFVRPEHAVLDFGCGGGTLLANLACARKVGVEINPVAREEAKSNGVEVYESLELVPDGVLDLAVSNHALEHVFSPLEALRTLRPKLKATGQLVLVVPIDDWRVQRDFDASDIDHHLYTWTPRLLGNLLAEAGYHVKEISVLTHAWFPRWEHWIGRLPTGVFDAICWAYSACVRRRQLLAVAAPTGDRIDASRAGSPLGRLRSRKGAGSEEP
jgi:SAM-dependent methyltransferase